MTASNRDHRVVSKGSLMVFETLERIFLLRFDGGPHADLTQRYRSLSSSPWATDENRAVSVDACQHIGLFDPLSSALAWTKLLNY